MHPIKNGYKVTLTDTQETELSIGGMPGYQTNALITAYIQVDSGNAGTIQFSQGDAIDSSHQAWPASSKITMRFVKDVANIKCKASAGGQSFAITF